MKICVLGSGANGAGIGADLVRAGNDVTFVEQWPQHVEAMRRSGLTVILPDEVQHTPVRAHHLCEVAEIREHFDVVLLLVKAYDTRWACELIKPWLTPDGVLVGLQNGMTTAGISGIVGADHTIGAVIEVTANLYDPGVVRRDSPPERSWFTLGRIPTGWDGRTEEVAAVLRAAGQTELSDDILSSKWTKLVLNAAELVPSAVLGLPFATSLGVPGIRHLMIRAGQEALEVGQRLGHRAVSIIGVDVDASDPGAVVDALIDRIVNHTALPHSRTTVLQDWDKGRRSEATEVNGLVAAHGRRLGVATPVNGRIAKIARDIESGLLLPGPNNDKLLLDELPDAM